MYLVTRQSLANKAASCWKAQYPELLGHREVTHKRLLALGPTPDPDEVDTIIGNTSWTCLPMCHECGNHPTQLVCFDDDREYSECVHVTEICKGCLAKALEL